MSRRVFALVMVIVISVMVFCVSSFGAFDGYAIRFNNQATLDKLALTNTTLTLKDGYTSFITTAHDPNAAYTFGAEDVLNADVYKFMVVRYRTNCKHNEGSTVGEMYFHSPSSGYDPGKTRITWNLNTNDEWTNVVIDLSGRADWAGNMVSLRIDYLEGNSLPADQRMDIAYIAVFKTKAEADAFNGDFGDTNPETGDRSVMFMLAVFFVLGTAVLKKKVTI